MLCRTCRNDNPPSDAVCRRCGRSLTALARGELMAGRFEIMAAIGSGGMGIVYKAHDRSLEEDVALKVLRPEFASTREAARRFQSEIKLARRVSDRHVCRIYEYGEDAGLRYICMELVDGVNLKQRIQDEGPLPPEEAYEAGVQIAEGLSSIHEAGVIHRDLKTPNIMLDRRGLVRLMDFGIARELDGTGAGLTMAGQVMGTPEYMSPEQALGHKLDLRSDLYSLGIVIYELFTGDVPFRGETAVATVLKQIEESADLAGRVPDAVIPVLARCLAKDRAHRFASARGVAAAFRLEPILKDLRRGDDTARWRAVLALGALGGGSRPAVMALLDAIGDEDEVVRRAAVAALGRLGDSAREAVPALIGTLRDDGLRDVATESLVQIGLPAVPGLLDALQNGTSAVRFQAAEALTRIGRAS